ncbi:MAG: STAS domain-containing protein [Gammaproteobacteria bacterium]
MLSVESVTQVDTSGIQALDVIHSELKAEGIQLLVARPKLFRAFFDNQRRSEQSVDSGDNG